LTLAGAAAISHDLYNNVVRGGAMSSEQELKLSRIATFGLGLLALLLGIAFEQQNIAVVVALALALAASVNFPLLIYAMYWRNLTSRGAVIGGSIVLIAALGIIVLSDSVWVQLLGNERPVWPYVYPTVATMPLAFVLIWLFSKLDRSPRAAVERGRFHAQFVRAETGVGAGKAAAH
ncbi:MAG: cation acetate symporter, partial [Pseudomonadota bacterium]